MKFIKCLQLCITDVKKKKKINISEFNSQTFSNIWLHICISVKNKNMVEYIKYKIHPIASSI